MRQSICEQCEDYGNKYQTIGKKKTCINPDSQYHGCKRAADKTCSAFIARLDGKVKGLPPAFIRYMEEIE